MSETQKTCPSCGGDSFEAWHSVRDKRLVGICVGCGTKAFTIRERQRPGRPKTIESGEKPIWEAIGITQRAWRYRVEKALKKLGLTEGEWFDCLNTPRDDSKAHRQGKRKTRE
jgi:ribosomal protein S27AE